MQEKRRKGTVKRLKNKFGDEISVRCTICRRFIEDECEIMAAYTDSGREVIFHADCAVKKCLSAADVFEMAGIDICFADAGDFAADG